MQRRPIDVLRVAAALLLLAGGASVVQADDLASYIRGHYTKREVRIPMRDGVRLFTSLYEPKDTSRTHPILMIRTPYSVAPYGKDAYRTSLGPNESLAREGFIFVYQDVRGRFLSEGTFVNMRPHVDHKTGRGAGEIDESSDTYDTIEWLLGHVPGHNGRVGMWGISYPGFYAAAGMIDAHPALRAVSPQAPIADWFFDDFHHHGAFFLPHAFNFLAVFGPPRKEPTTKWGPRFDHGTPDGYRFFLDLGPLRNVNERYFHGGIPFWNDIVAHPDYDDFWKARNLLGHLHRVAPAVLTVGGWFDAEDLYGALHIYRDVEGSNPGIFNALVMGPWRHGGWARTDGDSLGNARFGAKTSLSYREKIETPFFRHYLEDAPDPKLPEASVFETGRNRWRAFDRWPPAGAVERTLYLRTGGGIGFEPPQDGESGAVEWISDPARPVPFTEAIDTGMTREYMTGDQRFAARRPDVAVFRSEPLEEPLTMAGPILADLWVSTSGTASDWVVKLIDVFPDDAPDPEGLPPGRHMGGYQMMVRSEVIRGRYRGGYDRPQAFVPDEPTRVPLPLQDVLHTFEGGHRIMVQIQSTWFPLVDRNPHHYARNVFLARDEDFVRATQRVYCGGGHPTTLRVAVLPAAGE